MQQIVVVTFAQSIGLGKGVCRGITHLICNIVLNASSRHRRGYVIVLVVALATISALLLMSLLINASSAEPLQDADIGMGDRSSASSSLPTTPQLGRSTDPSQQHLPILEEAPQQAEQQVVMRVNSTPVYLDELLRVQRLNVVMNSFVAQSANATPQAELEQLLNAKLVGEAVRAADFHLEKGRYAQSLAQWLAANQKTQADLLEMLRANDFTVEEFTAHFQQLLLFDAFLTQQATAHNQSRPALLRQLQEQARISFGSAASAYLRSQETSEPTAVVPAPDSAPTASIPDRQKPNQPAAHFAQFPGLTVQETMQSSIATATTATANSTAATVTADPTPTPAPVGIAPGNRAPTFTLAALDAEPAVRNLADWHGTPIVLSFWTTWCPYCRKQIPVLVAANQLTRTEQVQFVGVNVNEQATTVRRYVATHQISFPTLLDSDGRIANSYGVRGYPTTYFIDANGHIVAKHIGVLSEAQLAGYIASLAP